MFKLQYLNFFSPNVTFSSGVRACGHTKTDRLRNTLGTCVELTQEPRDPGPGEAAGPGAGGEGGGQAEEVHRVGRLRHYADQGYQARATQTVSYFTTSW